MVTRPSNETEDTGLASRRSFSTQLGVTPPKVGEKRVDGTIDINTEYIDYT